MKKKYIKYINNNYKFDKLTKIGMICSIISIAGCFGWLYEFIFYFFNGGMQKFYWRGGNFLPWINIYATGSIIILILAYKQRKNPIKVFFTSMISCGILEYFSGLFIFLLLDGKRSWNYNLEILNFGNIGGFVCLRSVIFFGLSGMFLIYVIVPFCFYCMKTKNKKIFITLSIIICSIILFDEFYNLIFARIFNLPRAISIYKKLGFNFVRFK